MARSDRAASRSSTAASVILVFGARRQASSSGRSSRTLRVLGGWTLAPALVVQSGQFLSVTFPQDIALSGNTGNNFTTQRAKQVLSNVYGSRTVNDWLNPAAFALPQIGTLGNMGWNTVLGPGYWSLDAALSKEVFRRGENQKAEIRAEAFNLTNSVRLNNPTTVFGTNTFGRILSAGDPRIMQLALKYFF